ncbi:hypothetical protein KKG83_01810 [Candidatus Micrarchaeota archaeon]|nr:hypothetical protein [Candidatus Micrarchaeota archaeon]MBU2476185.1 hypothetical protein [Candidatus Micrarchaeota archaeon]
MKAQISLELLLLMSVFFSVLLLFSPLISKTFYSGIYSLDVIKAKSFSDSFSVAVKELNSMSNDSKITVTAKPLTKWKVSSEENFLKITVFLEKYEKEKTFSEKQLNLLSFEAFFSEETVFILTKTEKGITAEIQKL